MKEEQLLETVAHRDGIIIVESEKKPKMRRVPIGIKIAAVALAILLLLDVGSSLLRGYRFIYRNGAWQLDFYAFQEKYRPYEPCGVLAYIDVELFIIKFNSHEEMAHDILTGSFTKEEIFPISVAMQTGVEIPNFLNLTEPEYPEGSSHYQILWSCKQDYSFRRICDDYEATIYVNGKSSWQESVARLQSFPRLYEEDVYTMTSVEPALDRNGKVYFYTAPSGHQYKSIIYEVNQDSKQIYVEELYSPNTATGDIPEQISIYGTVNGLYYSVQMHNLKERPAEQWLLSFGLHKHIW